MVILHSQVSTVPTKDKVAMAAGTTRKQLIDESEAKYRRLFEAAQDGILILDADTGKITDVNPFLTDMLGYPREELLGKELWEIGPFKDIEASREAFRELLSQGYVRYENLPLENKSGQRKSVEFVSNVYNVDGKSVIQCNIRDITARVQAEHTLKYSEVKYRRLFEAAQDGILILNADTGQITDVNPFLTDMLGYPREELLGKKLWEIGPFKDIEASRGAFRELQSQRYVRYEHLPLENKSGQRMSVEFVSNVYNVDGKRVIQCNIRDITKRVQAEQEQERLSRQLQAKVSELETFSYGIAHDLRSPLVSIEGFSRLLLEDIQNQKVENVQEDIRLLESGVRKMQNFLNSTLEYSRAGHLIKRTRNVSFSKIVNEAITEFNEQISSIGATVATAKTFPRVDVDRAMIIQVLTNLIQNSIKYRDKTVPLKIEIGHRLSAGEAVFFVRDNGPGIDASEAEKVFVLFYRGTAEGEGSGIGLTIVKKIIEAHGGRIWVQEGQSGKGTTMCFTLHRQHGTNKDNNHGKD
jgi:PAS domain S-box-containing protein